MTGAGFLADRPLTILFLDADNAGRSLIAEAVLRHRAGPQVRVLSAGRAPAATAAPEVAATLAAARIPADGLAPKTWRRFRGLFQPRIDVVIFLCGEQPADGADIVAALPGKPQSLQWPMEDPGEVAGAVARRVAYDHVRRKLERICGTFVALMREEIGHGATVAAPPRSRGLAPHDQRPIGQRRVPA